jgi:hypothetical protein
MQIRTSAAGVPRLARAQRGQARQICVMEIPIMIDECVVAVYDALDEAEAALKQLVSQGVPPERISLVTLSLRGQPAAVAELELSDDALYDAAVSAGLGGIIGILAGLSVTILSGGILFLFGPLFGGITGGVTGGFIGAMVGSGIHEHQIARYESLLQHGKTLIIVNGDPLQMTQAHRVLEETQPVELHTYARAAEDEVASR